jgi:transposase-like protein
MTDLLKNPIFNDETAAREWLEARFWPQGPTCPHCGNADKAKLKAMRGKAHRAGLYQCAECREQFTVTVKTVFERSKIPLTKWLAALFLMTASKKGVSAHQVHRMLGISYKSTWFMMHRLREAMRTGGLADETYFGNVPKGQFRKSPQRGDRPCCSPKMEARPTCRVSSSVYAVSISLLDAAAGFSPPP